ncbi:MAG: dephospho-CoA kinase [Pseudonocardiaceae bacterium]
MLRVGLTGGIGSGKSTVARRLAEHGAIVIDADAIAREVVEPGEPALADIVTSFGADVLDADGRLNRPMLAAKAFVDDESRTKLNAIMHPRIGERTTELIAGAHADAIVVHDIPLLVEGGLAPAYHLVIVVDAPEAVRVRRIVQARGMVEADALARIAAQASEVQRRAAADIWLDNSGAQDAIEAEVDALWADRLVPFEGNVRLHRMPHRGAPRIEPYDPTWPIHAERIVARLRLAAGKRALRVDHIGSTAVPKLAAKNVIDVQLTVASLEDADALTGPLSDAGFPALPGFDQDTITPEIDPDPEHWLKRTHASADPGRWVNVHLRVLDSPGWRCALLFRDWLRDDEAAREEYERLTVALATEHAGRTIAEYTAAEDPWFTAASVRAEKWAARTGWTP